MAARTSAEPSKRAPRTLTALNKLIVASEPLTPGAERAVLGEGPLGAAIAFVGEQPGDVEETEGRPFVGPAGKLLRRMMEDAGLRPERAYLTNAVKHFKFVQRGKKRLHQRPTAGEVERYRWWLGLELDFVDPKLVVALGATAVRALVGKPLPIEANRGPYIFGERQGYITVHPSALLRIPEQAARRAARATFLADLKKIKALAAKATPRRRA
ncbi:MAG TPA: UdgX family uracil-DNA binding protein [Vitreimonas sp.]|nr:UdgX family uracil-DNA binding protein [Vitreimonas sp.]